jgi:hypothetical protein
MFWLSDFWYRWPVQSAKGMCCTVCLPFIDPNIISDASSSATKNSLVVPAVFQFCVRAMKFLMFHVVRRGRADICPTGWFGQSRFVMDFWIINRRHGSDWTRKEVFISRCCTASSDKSQDNAFRIPGIEYDDPQHGGSYPPTRDRSRRGTC